MKKNGITEYYEEVETTEAYDGYFCSVSEAITIVILGSICGLKNVSRIHQWATNDRVSEFLREEFGINHEPCYYWLLCLLKMVKTESLNQCFANWVYSFIPEKAEALTIALDGKTICSTTGMDSYSKPLHNLFSVKPPSISSNFLREEPVQNRLFPKSCLIVCWITAIFLELLGKIDLRGSGGKGVEFLGWLWYNKHIPIYFVNHGFAACKAAPCGYAIIIHRQTCYL